MHLAMAILLIGTAAPKGPLSGSPGFRHPFGTAVPVERMVHSA
jgi:hypothetical protein